MEIFNRAIGMTMGAYLTQFRIAHAQRLLLMTDLTVREVASSCGFTSPS